MSGASAVISLDGPWTLQKAGSRETIPATVPGGVHADLLAAGKIEDPFAGDNEDRQRWIYKADWIYRREFAVPPAFLKHDRLLLRCEGLDTVSAITINGKRLASTDNMYRTWELDVRALVRAGKNEIAIRFGSPLDYIAAKQKIRPIEYPSAPRQIPAFSLIRKEACSFGWDWGPTFATCGIWRPISLVAFNTARLSDVRVRQDHSARNKVTLQIAVGVERFSSEALSVRTTLTFKGKPVGRQEQAVRGRAVEGRMAVSHPQLWWPRNMGPQNLYELVVEIMDAQGNLLDRQGRRLGLRTLSLVREKDQWGESFAFQANGVPFFAKGANWIPADAFATRLTMRKVGELLSSAAAANMNMIRVWGGGVYEPDGFYDLCDELGLCVWQDFMFACAPYPLEDKAFVDNAMIEMEQNVLRLRHHACLALWCGNNEIESCGFAADKADIGHMALRQYKGFFEKRIPEMLARLDPERSYWPGSPYKETGERYNPDFWIDNPGKGDAHLWSVWHGRKPFEFFRSQPHRFVSEFGFQSFPEPATVGTFTQPADRNITSYVMEAHQRCGSGNTVIMQYMLDWFRMPADFDSTLWLSQLLQALAMKMACEHWRQSMPRTMGALIWQLNDTWPGASWSTLDYFGRWKATHYFARRFFAPLLVSAVENVATGTVQPYVTSDLAEPARCLLSWTLTDVEGKLLRRGQQDVLAESRRNTRGVELCFKDELDKVGARNILLWLELAAEKQPVSRNLVLFARPKHLELQDPRIIRRIASAGNGAFRVTLLASKPALWAWLEIPGLHLACTDQFISLEPGRAVEITATPDRAMTLREFSRALKVRSLFDTSA